MTRIGFGGRVAGVLGSAVLLYASAGQVYGAGPSWQWLNPKPQGNTVTAIVCASVTVCVANATRAVMRSADAGATWTPTAFPLQGGVTAFACPSDTVCYATGATGDAALSTDGGQTWMPLTTGIVGDFLVAISCPTISTCYAVGDQGSIVATTDGGATWVSHRNGPAFYQAFSISCPTASECFLGNSHGLLETTDGGLSWAVVLNQYTQAVSCPSPQTCYAAGNPTFVTTNGGLSWATENVAGANRGLIACADVLHCVQSGNTPVGDAILLSTSDGANWTATLHLHYPVNFIDAIGCTNGLECIVGGSLGVLYLTIDGGRSWVELDVAVTRNNFAAISCNADTFCVAVGGSTDAATLFIAVSRDGGSSWMFPRVSVDDSLTGVSCASTTACVTAGLNANIASTTDGGTSWHVTNVNTGPNLNMFVGVSCPSISVCYAATQGGLVFKSKDGGLSWAVRGSFNFNFRGIDCPTALVCYATSPQIGQSVIARTIDGGAHWATATLPGVLVWSVSCTDRTHCVGAGTCHSVFYCIGYQAVVTTDGGKSWTATDPINDSPNFVSCGSATSCVMVGAVGQGPGNIQVSTDGGFTWAEQRIVDDNQLAGISCSSTRCWAVGDAGGILTSPV